MEYTPTDGEHIEVTVGRMLRIAEVLDEAVTTTFCGVRLIVQRGDYVDSTLERYYARVRELAARARNIDWNASGSEGNVKGS